MTGTITVIGFVLALVLVILIHEAAHFAAAKRFGIKVEEYFVGFGPKLWSTRRGETEYGVKAIVLGGYVKIAGMDPYRDPAQEDLPRTFGAKPIWQRATVIAAGPLTHFVLAFVVLFLYLALVGRPTEFSASVSTVTPTLNQQTSPAAAAGLRAGDVVVAINGRPANIDNFSSLIQGDRSLAPLSVEVERNGQRVNLQVTPVIATLDGQTRPYIGVVLASGAVIARDRPGVLGAFTDAGTLMWTGTRQVVQAVGRIFGPEGLSRQVQLLFGHAQRNANDPVSIVGGARMATQAADSGQFDALVALFVSFNLFIGLFNLLPLPPFDGGHLAVLAIEKVRGKRVDMRKVVPIGAAVAVLLIVFVLGTVYLDVAKPVPNLFP